MPMPLKFFSKGSAAGQFFTLVDRHRTRTTNCRAAGVAERQTPVALLLDANESVEYGHSTPDVDSDILRMGNGINFGIEPLNGEGQAHGLVLSYEC